MAEPGKESVQLDLKTGPGMAALHALLGRADVLVANLSPRVLGELGLTPGALADRHPGLVVCTISGYDPGGAWADRKAYDALIQAETGLMALTGTVDAPAKTGISVADIAAGSVAFTGVLAAIRHRDRTGKRYLYTSPCSAHWRNGWPTRCTTRTTVERLPSRWAPPTPRSRPTAPCAAPTANGS